MPFIICKLNNTAISNADRELLSTQLGHVVEAVNANFGVQVSANGEQLILVDESGFPIRGENARTHECIIGGS